METPVLFVLAWVTILALYQRVIGSLRSEKHWMHGVQAKGESPKLGSISRKLEGWFSIGWSHATHRFAETRLETVYVDGKQIIQRIHYVKELHTSNKWPARLAFFGLYYYTDQQWNIIEGVTLGEPNDDGTYPLVEKAAEIVSITRLPELTVVDKTAAE